MKFNMYGVLKFIYQIDAVFQGFGAIILEIFETYSAEYVSFLSQKRQREGNVYFFIYEIYI